MRAQEARVTEGIVGLVGGLVECKTKADGWIVMLIGRRRRGVRVVYMRLLMASRKRPAASLSLLIHDVAEFRSKDNPNASKTKPRRKETTRTRQSAFRHRGDAMPRGGAVRSQGDAMGGGASYHDSRRVEGVAKRAGKERDRFAEEKWKRKCDAEKKWYDEALLMLLWC